MKLINQAPIWPSAPTRIGWNKCWANLVDNAIKYGRAKGT